MVYVLQLLVRHLFIQAVITLVISINKQKSISWCECDRLSVIHLKFMQAWTLFYLWIYVTQRISRVVDHLFSIIFLNRTLIE